MGWNSLDIPAVWTNLTAVFHIETSALCFPMRSYIDVRCHYPELYPVRQIWRTRQRVLDRNPGYLETENAEALVSHTDDWHILPTPDSHRQRSELSSREAGCRKAGSIAATGFSTSMSQKLDNAALPAAGVGFLRRNQKAGMQGITNRM
ncbi:hypothetical protein FE257_005451 [Aspergillus nanangensis]|uniref:Uncharacterized protein n=1 Tax=Aspergillus nanangensis TaxID=2582783 RepID=A0AAD4GVP8_ASPNN|nr:hypothetical protein FE257_005451 [Aspergillus nanangensis]